MRPSLLSSTSFTRPSFISGKTTNQPLFSFQSRKINSSPKIIKSSGLISNNTSNMLKQSKWDAITSRNYGVSNHSLQRNYSSLKLNRKIGQPIHNTHPHLVKQGDLSVGFDAAEFSKRRVEFSERLTPNSLAIIPSAAHPFMSNDIPFRFRQNSNFYYLTGFLEPESVLVFDKASDGSITEYLFVRKRDPERELWEGACAGIEGAEEFGIENVQDFKMLPEQIDSLLRQKSAPTEEVRPLVFLDTESLTFTGTGTTTTAGTTLRDAVALISDAIQRGAVNGIQSPQGIFWSMRRVKSPREMAMMRRSGAISAAAFRETMKKTSPGMTEFHVDALLEFEMRMRGAQRHAYPPVVAAGNSANTLHYIANDDIIREGELILVDAGCEYHMFSSDITRTWPVSGRFSSEQRQLYERVLDIQKKIIQMCKPGATMSQLFSESIRLTCDALCDLGIVNMTAQELLKSGKWRQFYPHNLGHLLGMDVHEKGSDMEAFVPGCVITVEPGIYVSADNPHVANEAFKGIGIRIEDDILITEDGYENLTQDVPKEPDEIEELILSGENDSKSMRQYLKSEHQYL
eukprot:gb/GECH01000810.1/.p1 GENE.gb/GECH01000810.1/~~gb/GECH01000810.1/.p1  ORF type:complete len:573 (+),score=161.43 gb/GECH01000810.1/:1-1719(+)